MQRRRPCGAPTDPHVTIYILMSVYIKYKIHITNRAGGKICLCLRHRKDKKLFPRHTKANPLCPRHTTGSTACRKTKNDNIVSFYLFLRSCVLFCDKIKQVKSYYLPSTRSSRRLSLVSSDQLADTSILFAPKEVRIILH